MRVLLLEVPRLLRGILEHAIEVDRGCELLKDVGHNLSTWREEAPQPDVVILGLTAVEDVALVLALFARWPQAQVMTVMQAGDDAAIYELRPRRQALGEVSPAEIVEKMREAVHRKREPPRN